MASSTTTSNVMLAIVEKKTNSIDFYRPLRNFIVINYSEREAQDLEDDLQTLKQLRSDIERGGSSDSPSARRDIMRNYYKALCAVESRFPISPDKDHVNTVSFTWFDAFKSKQKATQQNIHLEKAAVLFNLGAVHSQIGLSYDRSTVEGRRQASHSFIAAAGAFAFLRDNVSMKASTGSSTTLDMSVACVGMLERLMLAQAQECVYENTIAKGSSPGVCAKISRQIESALPSLARPIMSLDVNEDAVVGVLKQSLRQLETLGAQRAGLEDMLKDMKRKDDILPKLMASTGSSQEDLFRKEISKYDGMCEDIAENLKAQEQLLMNIQGQNDKFTAIFNVEDYKASREKGYKQIEAAIVKFREIKENINEGLKFYVLLQDAITNVKQQCSDFVMTRNIQCREMIDEVQRKISGLSFQDDKNTSGYSYPSVGQPHRTNSQQQPDPAAVPPSSYAQTPTYQPPQQPSMHAYSQTPYGTPQQQHPSYHATVSSSPYTPPQHLPPSVNHEYGQPAYPGWQGPYYNPAPPQQRGSIPNPPYTVPSPYPPSHYSSFYRQ